MKLGFQWRGGIELWIIAAYGGNGFDDEVYQADTYEKALEIYNKESLGINPKWNGRLVIAEIKESTQFPLSN